MRLRATFYRMKFAHEAADILAPAHTPEGRFHYGGQSSLYLSATAQGTYIASRRYMREGDLARLVFPLEVQSDRVIDLRDAAAVAFFGIDVTDRAVEWQNDRTQSRPARTWAISDKVRALGLDGMFYASRSTAGLCHLVLFNWNVSGAAQVRPNGAPIEIEPPL